MLRVFFLYRKERVKINRLLLEKNEQVEQQINNYEDAIFVILHTLVDYQAKSKSPTDISNLLSKLSTVSINSIIGIPIKKGFKSEVIKGSLIAKEVVDSYYKAIENNHMEEVNIKLSVPSFKK